MSHFPCTNIIVPLAEIFEGTTVPSKNSLYPQIGGDGVYVPSNEKSCGHAVEMWLNKVEYYGEQISLT